jgi:hypothetical protein
VRRFAAPGDLTALLAAPVFLYAGAVLVRGAIALDGLALLGALLAALPLARPLLPTGRALLGAAPAGGAGASLALGAIGGFAPGAPGLGFASGFLAALPLTALAVLLAYRRQPAVVLPLVVGGLAGLFALDAASGALTAGNLPGSFVASVAGVLVGQAEGLGQLAYGASSVALPLQDVADPVLLVLALVAVAGAFLALFEEPAGRAIDADPLALLVPVGVGVVAAVGFEALAARAPDGALLTVAGSVVAVFALLLYLDARSARRGRRAAPSPTPAAAPGS